MLSRDLESTDFGLKSTEKHAKTLFYGCGRRGVVEAARSSRVTQTKNSVENVQFSTEFLFQFQHSVTQDFRRIQKAFRRLQIRQFFF